MIRTGEFDAVIQMPRPMRYAPLFAIALASIITALLFAFAGQALGAEELALSQRRMQEESIVLEQKQARSAQEPTIAPTRQEQRRQLSADQRMAQERLQQRQLQLRTAAQQAERAIPNQPPAPEPSVQTQIFDRERQQQDLSFDIQRQQLQFRQRMLSN